MVDGATAHQRPGPVRGPERGRHHQPGRSPALPRPGAEVDSRATRPTSPRASWDLGFTLRSYLGNYVYNNVASANGRLPGADAGTRPTTCTPRCWRPSSRRQQLQSDFYVEDASFLRMDNLTLGYTFNLRGQSARVFGTVQNVFTITGYSGVDPSANIVPPNARSRPRSTASTTTSIRARARSAPA